MTDTDKVVEVPEAPAGHYYAVFQDRHILVRNINPAQSMVLGGFLRQIKSEIDYDKVMDIFGKLMLLVENLIVLSEDVDWFVEQIMANKMDVADFAEIFHSHTAEKSEVPVRKPRRGK